MAALMLRLGAVVAMAIFVRDIPHRDPCVNVVNGYQIVATSWRSPCVLIYDTHYDHRPPAERPAHHGKNLVPPQLSAPEPGITGFNTHGNVIYGTTTTGYFTFDTASLEFLHDTSQPAWLDRVRQTTGKTSLKLRDLKTRAEQLTEPWRILSPLVVTIIGTGWAIWRFRQARRRLARPVSP